MSKDDRELIERINRMLMASRIDEYTTMIAVEPDDLCDIRTRLEALQAQPVGEEGPCPDGEHCCCCGPGDTCCDCGLKLIDLEREVALARWTDFLDMNPDDLTSPEDLPDHALVTFEQFYEMARDVLPRIPAALTASPPVVEREAIAALRARLDDIRDDRHFPAHMMSAHDEMLSVLDEMEAALSTPVAQGDEVRDALEPNLLAVMTVINDMRRAGEKKWADRVQDALEGACA